MHYNTIQYNTIQCNTLHYNPNNRNMLCASLLLPVTKLQNWSRSNMISQDKIRLVHTFKTGTVGRSADGRDSTLADLTIPGAYDKTRGVLSCPCMERGYLNFLLCISKSAQKTSKNRENRKNKTTFTLTTFKVVRVKVVLVFRFSRFLTFFWPFENRD